MSLGTLHLRQGDLTSRFDYAVSMVEFLAEQFGVESPEIAISDFATERRVLFYHAKHKTVHIPYDFNPEDEKYTYALLHEFAHHLEFIQHGFKKLHHGPLFCRMLVKVIKEWGQIFERDTEYDSVRKRIAKEVADLCPAFIKGRKS